MPGGSRDNNDISFVQTALREAKEEVNLNPSHVKVVCTSPRVYSTLHTVTLITPVVALVSMDTDELNLVPYPPEVDCLYWVPLEFFVKTVKMVDTVDSKFTRVDRFYYSDPTTGINHEIFGVTAYVCAILSAMALSRLPASTIFRPIMLLQVNEDKKSESTTLIFGEVMLTRKTVMTSRSKL